MASLLDDYRMKQENLKKKCKDGSMHPNEILVLQELNYRVYVLETLQMFYKTSPPTTDMSVVSMHYQVLRTYINLLIKEHGMGVKADDDLKKKRETAKGNLENIMLESCKQFNSFQVTSSDQYKKCVSRVVNTVLAAWVQYRNTYINI